MTKFEFLKKKILQINNDTLNFIDLRMFSYMELQKIVSDKFSWMIWTVVAMPWNIFILDRNVKIRSIVSDGNTVDEWLGLIKLNDWFVRVKNHKTNIFWFMIHFSS